MHLHRCRIHCLVLFLYSATVSLAIASSSTECVEVATQPEYNPSAESAYTLHVSLWNNCAKPIMALSTKTVFKGLTATGYSVDFLASVLLNGYHAAAHPLALGEKHEFTSVAPQPVDTGLVGAVTVTAVIFDDGTTLGDSKAIAEISQRRKTDADDYTQKLEILDRLSSSVNSAAERLQVTTPIEFASKSEFLKNTVAALNSLEPSKRTEYLASERQKIARYEALYRNNVLGPSLLDEEHR